MTKLKAAMSLQRKRGAMKREVRDARKTTTDAARANQVYRWIIQGATEFDIREAMQQAWPDASHADILLSAIEKRFESQTKSTRRP